MAGFANGTPSASLFGLHYPIDLLVDGIGNMHIVDYFNNRILYWPVNSAEGRIVAGTNESGSDANQLNLPRAIAGNDHLCQPYKRTYLSVTFLRHE